MIRAYGILYLVESGNRKPPNGQDRPDGKRYCSRVADLHQAMVALGHPYGLDVTLVDGDRISRTNCVRQPFSESEIGLHKATVLATRINLFWGLGWKGVPHFVDESWGHETDILIGCVDSRAARNTMTRTQTYWNCLYWLDLGNNAGQRPVRPRPARKPEK